MEDLTLLLPKKIRVDSDENAIVPCPFCGKVLSISSAEICRSCQKDYMLTCKCNKKFYVRFEIKKRSITELKVTVTDLVGNHTYNNISIQQLSQNHLNFTCKEQHQMRKGQKLRVNFISTTSHFFETRCNAIVRLMRGTFISCHFVKAVNLPYATSTFE